MFSNYFFIILLLVLLSALPNEKASLFPSIDLRVKFFVACAFYNVQLWLTYVCGRLWKGSQERFIFISSAVLLLYFFAFLTIFASREPLMPDISGSIHLFFCSLLVLSLYFMGLFTARYGWERQIRGRRAAVVQAWNAVRFLMPITLPFLFFILLNSFFTFMPVKAMALKLHIENVPLFVSFLAILSALCALLLVFFLLPPLMIRMWGCKPLENTSLEMQLQSLCKQAKFTHAGFRRWSIMGEGMNAGIMGITGRFRYVVFTDDVLNKLPTRCIKAILAHEIGHNKHKHLLLYPLIFAGMFLSLMLVSLLIEAPLLRFFQPQGVWRTTLFFITSSVIMAFYYRYLFGHFSRLFERQADLHLFALSLPPEDMVQALNHLAVNTAGRTRPNWHHYSVQERVTFIQSAVLNPSLIAQHHRKVRTHLILLFIFLIGAALYVFRS